MKENAVKAIREDIFTSPLVPLEDVRLRGMRCRNCGQAFLGDHATCEQCMGESFEEIVYSKQGKLWSYTVLRHRPPGDYKGPDPYEPFAVGWVSLPEKLMVLSPLADCALDQIEVGMDVELIIHVLYKDEEGNDVLAYKFKPSVG